MPTNFLRFIQLKRAFAAQISSSRKICGGAPVKAILFLIFVLFSSNVFGQSEPNQIAAANVGVEKIYLAKDNGGEAGEAAEVFSTTDIPIHCVVHLSLMNPAIIKMNFIAVNVQGVKPGTKVISVVYKTNGSQNEVNFTGKPEGVWIAGIYRIDIFVDGAAAGNKEFEIRKSANEVQKSISLDIKNLVSPKTKIPRRARKN
jgi:hypothetical protein